MTTEWEDSEEQEYARQKEAYDIRCVEFEEVVETLRAENKDLREAVVELRKAVRSTLSAMGSHGPCEGNDCARCASAFDGASSAYRKTEGLVK